MAEIYFNQRADDCLALAAQEADRALRDMLLDLASHYQDQARLALQAIRAH